MIAGLLCRQAFSPGLWTASRRRLTSTTPPNAQSSLAVTSTAVMLVEIDREPYLVRTPEEAFDNGERPINVDASNLVWVDTPGVTGSASGPKVAYLWGKLQAGQSNGTFVKLPAEFTGEIHSQGSTFRAVVIGGQPQYLGEDVKILEPGSNIG